MAIYCVVGLGNPGTKYTGTRHNLGFGVVDRLAAEHNTRIRRQEYLALTAAIEVGRTEVLLMKPQTYMNLSGRSVAAACKELALPLDRVVVVHDDVDLEVGRLRVRASGSAGGHRGIASIIEETGETQFARVKLGVGRPPEGVPTSDYVLEAFRPGEEAAVGDALERATAAVKCIVRDGVDVAMREFNSPVVDA